MSRTLYPSQIKRELKKHHDELIERGFLTSVRYEQMTTKDEEKVVYEFPKKALKTPKSDNGGSGLDGKTSPEAIESPIINDLVQVWGFTLGVARDLVKRHSEAR